MKKKNVMFTIFLQQILNSRLLLITKKKKKFSGGFKLEPITT